MTSRNIASSFLGAAAAAAIGLAATPASAQEAGVVHLPLPGFFSAGQRRHALEQTAADVILTDQPERIGALDIGFASGAGGLTAAQMTTFGTLDVLFLLGADDIKVPDGTLVVYIGTHGDRGAHRADVILPGAAYTEKSGIYVNTEGRVQMANRASFPPGEAREDWAIVRALSDVLGKKLPWDSLAALRQSMFKAVPHLMRIDQIEAGKADDIKKLAGKGGSGEKATFKTVEDF